MGGKKRWSAAKRISSFACTTAEGSTRLDQLVATRQKTQMQLQVTCAYRHTSCPTCSPPPGCVRERAAKSFFCRSPFEHGRVGADKERLLRIHSLPQHVLTGHGQQRHIQVLPLQRPHETQQTARWHTGAGRARSGGWGAYGLTPIAKSRKISGIGRLNNARKHA